MNINDLFIKACEIGNARLAKYLLDHGADVHVENDLALCWARERNRVAVVKILEEHINKGRK